MNPKSPNQTQPAVLQHTIDCWGKDGPGYELRESVQELKAWVRGVGIALLLLQLLSTGHTVAGWLRPTAAHAQPTDTPSHTKEQ